MTRIFILSSQEYDRMVLPSALTDSGLWISLILSTPDFSKVE